MAKEYQAKFRRAKGQAAVEYILSTLMILVMFTSMYAFLQQQTKRLFTAAARVIVRAYHD